MTGPDPHRTDPGGRPADPPPARDAVTPLEPPDPPTTERLDRLADLVADGEVDFPAGLGPADAARLTVLVRRRLRDRLVRYIARQIALDIHRAAGTPDSTEG